MIVFFKKKGYGQPSFHKGHCMPRIPVDKIEVGMKLVRPITDKNGMVLLSEGTVLTEKWVERIQDMSIEAIYIDGPSVQPIPKDEALSLLNARFQHVEDQPHMGFLKKVVREYIEGLYG
jgi:hypothetical protein